jgi:hypothetical protein
VAGTCSDQVFVDHADINNNFGYTNLMCKVASELGITAVHDTLVDTEVVVFEIKVADVAADLKRVGLRAS